MDDIAARLFAQLQTWSEKGFNPLLHHGKDGWQLALDNQKWEYSDHVNDRTPKLVVRFCTDPQPTPQAAIEAALKVVQP